MAQKWFSDILKAFASPAPYVSWAIGTAVLTLSGSFGAIQPLPLDQRLLLFGSVVALLLVWGIVARLAVQNVLPGFGFWAASTLVIMSSAVVLAPVVHEIAHWVTGLQSRKEHGWVVVALLIVGLGYAAALTRWLLSNELSQPESGAVTEDAAPATVAIATATAEDAGPRLLRRLDPALRGRLIRVSGRNHHVEVVTDKGTSLLLLRLADALAELQEADGLRVHRSHWVALPAVTGSRNLGGNPQLVLSDGSVVPVSRSQRPEVERRGLI
jgi:hypothetical protein